MTVRQLQAAIISKRAGRSSLLMLNTFPLRWAECDVLEITTSLLWHEYELKLSVADFARDFHKTVYTKGIGNEKKHDVISRSCGVGPNYFSYVLPKGLIAVERIPTYAGLYEVDEARRCAVRVKMPKRLHVVPFDSHRLFNVAIKRAANFNYSDLYSVWQQGDEDVEV